MRKTNKQNGITLVALVITIIILLILAGISISALTNQGLFAKAQQAKQESENAQREENEILADYLEQMETITGGEEEPIKLQPGDNLTKAQPGDYVTYIPDTASTTAILNELSTYSGTSANTSSTLTQETGLKWRVLDVKDGKVRLISELPTESKITLKGAKGYNNAVYLLDKTCKTLYSKAGYSENVQSLKIEDVQDYLAYDYTQYANSNVDTGKYGGTKTITNSYYRYYPNLFKKEKTGWVDGTQGTELDLSKQTAPINETSTRAGSSIKVTQTYWYKSMVQSDFSKSIYYNLFIINGNNYPTYWMSSRCIKPGYGSGDGIAGFSVNIVDSGKVTAYELYNSYDYTYDAQSYSLRPVVTLNSNVQVKSGEGTESSAYEI